MYYKINEEAAKRANDANRFCEYQQGSATANYHRMVDKAVEIAENQKSVWTQCITTRLIGCWIPIAVS